MKKLGVVDVALTLILNYRTRGKGAQPGLGAYLEIVTQSFKHLLYTTLISLAVLYWKFPSQGISVLEEIR